MPPEATLQGRAVCWILQSDVTTVGKASSFAEWWWLQIDLQTAARVYCSTCDQGSTVIASFFVEPCNGVLERLSLALCMRNTSMSSIGRCVHQAGVERPVIFGSCLGASSGLLVLNLHRCAADSIIRQSVRYFGCTSLGLWLQHKQECDLPGGTVRDKERAARVLL